MFKVLKITFISTTFLLTWFTICSQEPVNEEHTFDCYQVYMEDDVKEVIKVEYTDDGTPLKFQLIEDGNKMLLEDYQGKKKIKYTILDHEGNQKEYSKSSCFIDPCEINL